MRLPVVYSKLAKSVVRVFSIFNVWHLISMALILISMLWKRMLFLPFTRYTCICISFITELWVPLMADGLGWVGLRNLDPWPSLEQYTVPQRAHLFKLIAVYTTTLHCKNVTTTLTIFTANQYIIKTSRADARKPRDAAAVLFDLKFADNIHYKLKSSQASKARLQSSKHTGVKQNLTQNGHSRSRVLESVVRRWGIK